MVHRLESTLVDNLMKKRNSEECIYDEIKTLQDGLDMKMGNNLKLKFHKTSLIFIYNIWWK